MAPRVDAEYQKEITKAREELKNLPKDKYSAADLLRLAYTSQFSIANSHHDEGTITSNDAKPNTQSANNNIKTAIENIKNSHRTITYPDLYQLAGVVALEMPGGPKIEFVPGREDSPISPDEGCLPDGSQGASDLRDVFRKVGISDNRDIVALSGGLEMARRAGPRTGETFKFDNSYFKELFKNKDSSQLQPTDEALVKDPNFIRLVGLYAENNQAFLKDYEVAHKKLSDLGLPDSPFLGLEKSKPVLNMPVSQRAVGVVVAAAVVILSVFYLINKRRTNKYSSQQFQ
ncbi:L-ascorbate peroxidase 3-like [Lycium ferocissimum]|uniref:L-ascorbate peroxidase 3-like n=1 Tax=Lycium ferocissimum TaxID=112874 RepID=UPI002816050D|nr:L-ascorbate peroxidase 3-like [Lycium ferocissimum]